MFNLFSPRHSLFGLDISGSSFKYVYLTKDAEGSIEVKAYADVPLPKGIILADEIVDSNTLKYLMQKSLENPDFGKLDTRFAAVSLPESKCFVRVIQIPKMTDSEAENAVPFEAENFIPMPIDQVYLDWQKIGETEDKINILIVASPKEFVDKYLTALDKVGIKIAALEVESQGCCRALVEAGKNPTQLIVDLDALRSNIIMIEDGQLQFTSTAPVAGNSFTESIARALGVSSQKAETIKRKVGVANTPEYPNLKTTLVPVLNNLSGEIKNILKFHFSHSQKLVEKIVLAGGSARLKNLPEYLKMEFQDQPDLQIELGNPWINIKNIKANPLDADASLSFTTAIGLGMRNII